MLIFDILKTPMVTKIAAGALAAGFVLGAASIVSWERGPLGLATKLSNARASIEDLRAKNKACQSEAQQLRQQRNTYAGWTVGWRAYSERAVAEARAEAAQSISSHIKRCRASGRAQFDAGLIYGQTHPDPVSLRPAHGVRDDTDDFRAWYRRRAADEE